MRSDVNKPHGPVSERIMRKFYGPSGATKPDSVVSEDARIAVARFCQEVPKIDYAQHVIRAKFAGRLPNLVSIQECYDLMIEYGNVQERRADHAEKELRDLLVRTPNRTVVTP